MRMFENATTKRIEARGRALGLNVAVCKSPDNSAGMFFIYNKDNQPLRHWISLGWTKDEALQAIAEYQAESAEYARCT